MNIDQLQSLAVQIKEAYDSKNTEAGRDKWNVSDYMAGFVGDVGDLSKLIMAKQNKRQIADVDKKLAHELSDCLWSVLIIANELEIDIEQVFKENMQELKTRVEKDL